MANISKMLWLSASQHLPSLYLVVSEFDEMNKVREVEITHYENRQWIVVSVHWLTQAIMASMRSEGAHIAKRFLFAIGDRAANWSQMLGTKFWTIGCREAIDGHSYCQAHWKTKQICQNLPKLIGSVRIDSYRKWMRLVSLLLLFFARFTWR